MINSSCLYSSLEPRSYAFMPSYLEPTYLKVALSLLPPPTDLPRYYYSHLRQNRLLSLNLQLQKLGNH